MKCSAFHTYNYNQIIFLGVIQKFKVIYSHFFNLKHKFTPDNIKLMHEQQSLIEKHPKFLILEIGVI